MRSEFAKLLKYLRKHQPDFDDELMRRAYRVANDAHKGQARLSGEPYIAHSLAVARILAQVHLDMRTIASGLLHDVIEDTQLTREDIARQFGPEIATLVDGVSKIAALHKPSEPVTHQQKRAENLRKMLVATAKDVRVVLIKLADRLHNMRTLEFLPLEKAKRISQETLDIYAPLAHRLGIERWKWELEDHAFHCLYPDEYRNIARKIAMKRREREATLNATIRFLEKHLEEAEVAARVIGRPKHLYSIYLKMIEQGKDFDDVMDIQAVRIITQTVAGCYNALGVVHHVWMPVPGRFKDYVAMPKPNMYQSIHTVVMRESGTPMEVQIRTEDMDRTAREGIASHWQYKEGHTDSKLDKRLEWLRQMYDWLVDASAPEELLDSVRRDVSAGEVYVFTPKGDVKELPGGSTALDFAYMVHSDVGHTCTGARVNGRMVPLHYHLQTGDMVEIMTSKAQHPHLDWLKIVVSGKARTRIRQRLRELGELDPLDVHIQIEPGDRVAPPRTRREKAHIDEATRHRLVRVQGVSGIEVNFAKCCNPTPAHPILAYTTPTGGIRIHRADCRLFSQTRRDPERVLEATWIGEASLDIGMRVTTGQRPNVLADITNAMRPMNVSIKRAQYHTGENGASYFDFVFEATGKDHFERIARTLLAVPGVTRVEKLPSSGASSPA